MTSARDLKALAQHLDHPDPGERLGAVAALRIGLEEIESRCVADAVRLGWSWTQIGAALGVSKQAAHARHRHHPAVASARNGHSDGHGRVVVSSETRLAVQLARDEAAMFGHPAIGTEHLLLGIVRAGSPRTAAALSAHGVSLERTRRALGKLPARFDTRRDGDRTTAPGGGRGQLRPISAPARRLLERAVRPSHDGGGGRLEIDALLHEMLNEPHGGAARTLERLRVSRSALRARLRRR